MLCSFLPHIHSIPEVEKGRVQGLRFRSALNPKPARGKGMHLPVIGSFYFEGTTSWAHSAPIVGHARSGVSDIHAGC